MKRTTEMPLSIGEMVMLTGKDALYNTKMGRVRIMNLAPGQEVEVDRVLHEPEKKLHWGLRRVVGVNTPYKYLAFRIREDR